MPTLEDDGAATVGNPFAPRLANALPGRVDATGTRRTTGWVRATLCVVEVFVQGVVTDAPVPGARAVRCRHAPGHR